MTPKQVLALHYKKIASLGGKAAADSMTAEQLSERGRAGAKARTEKLGQVWHADKKASKSKRTQKK